MAKAALSMEEILSRKASDKQIPVDVHPTVKTVQQSPTEEVVVASDELKVLFPETNTYDVNGETVSIRVFTFGELDDMMKLIEIVQAVSVGEDGATLSAAKKTLNMMSSKELKAILCKNINKPVEWLDSLQTPTVIVLMGKLVVVNVDFFTKHVLPVLI